MVSTDSQQDTVIVVLGGSNDKSGQLSQMSLDRCHKALSLHLAHPSLRILTTGGWGQHFNESPIAHGELMKQHLIAQGLDATLFLPVAHSSYTEADAVEAAKVLAEFKPRTLFLVTSDFHMERALHYFSQVFPKLTIQAFPAESSLPPAELRQRTEHERMRMRTIRAEMNSARPS